MAWLIDDAYVKFFTKTIELDDDDKSSQSWDRLVAEFASIVDHILWLMKRGGAKILICDPSGNSSSPAIMAAVMLIKSQVP